MLAYRNTGARALAPVRRAARCSAWSWNLRQSPLGPPIIDRGVDAPRASPRLPPSDPPARVHPAPRLVRRLREARDAPFVLLVAPAGYGKTTLLSEWAAGRRRFAWIDLGAGDHDPERSSLGQEDGARHRLPRCSWWTTRTSSARPRRSTPWTTWRARCRPGRSLRWRPGASRACLLEACERTGGSSSCAPVTWR